jgi:DNA-directed RNA polymerase subunit H (RpoH/RPB5)
MSLFASISNAFGRLASKAFGISLSEDDYNNMVKEEQTSVENIQKQILGNNTFPIGEYNFIKTMNVIHDQRLQYLKKKATQLRGSDEIAKNQTKIVRLEEAKRQTEAAIAQIDALIQQTGAVEGNMVRINRSTPSANIDLASLATALGNITFGGSRKRKSKRKSAKRTKRRSMSKKKSKKRLR